jgi:hypothetical protein
MNTIKDVLTQPRRALQLSLVLVGVVFVMIGVLADQLGIGRPGGLGLGQVLLIVFGIVVILVALLGNKAIVLYKSLALLALNTLLLFLFLELGSIFLMRSGLIQTFQESVRAESQEVPYYAARDWSETYWREAPQAENYRYEPYVVWSHNPYEGETIIVSQEGNRRTPGAVCHTDAYKVFALGGSTMWGWGAPDWGTIPAYLQEGLSNQVDRPVCVVNYAEDGFVSTQSVITLMRLLQSGKIPDQVIFYDGVNDVYAAFETGQPGVHPTLENVAAKFEDRNHPLMELLRDTRLYALAEFLAFSFMQGEAGESALEPRAQLTAANVEGLAESMDLTFDSSGNLIWQLTEKACHRMSREYSPALTRP